MNVLEVEHGREAGASAVFSADRKKRYRLSRKIADGGSRRALFVMLNPSTADAFKLDPTITKCAELARRWGMNDLEVVNLYALRSSKPADLYACWENSLRWLHSEEVRLERIGADRWNDSQILEACAGAERVIAAWGNHGNEIRIGARGPKVRKLLESVGVELYHLGLTESGAPLHPLARGKSWIPYDRQPQRWA